MSRTSNFTNSPLATIRNIHGSKKNGSGNFTRRISKITIHHTAGVINGANLLAWGHNPSCGASWNYGIGNDGIIGLMIEEKDRAWTSSSPANDYQAVTIEVSNSTTGGEWPVGNRAYTALINLCVDICERNNIPRLTFDGTPNGSLTHHSMFASTSCPGKFLLDRFKAICDEVNRQLGAVSNTPNTSATTTTPLPTPAPNPSPNTSTSDIFRVQVGAFSQRANAEKLLAELKSKGYEDAFIAVSDGLNRVQIGAYSVRANADAAVTAMKAAGYKDAFITTTASAPKKTNEEIAREVIRGNWGNGQDRINRLIAAGYDAKAVQAIVNTLV